MRYGGRSPSGRRPRDSNMPASRSAVRFPKKAGVVTPCRLRFRWPVRYSTLVARLAMATPAGSFWRIHSASARSRRATLPAISP